MLTYAAALLAWLKGPDGRSARPQPAAPAGVAADEASLALLNAVQPVAAAPLAAKAPPNPVLLARLVQAREGEALYRDPDLLLSVVAQHLGLPPNTIAHLISAGIGQTFTAWVSNCPLTEVKRRLLPPPDAARYTLLALALEAGFNSKSTFDRAFKERNNLMPGQYQKR